jgi:hypothetical protein
VAFTPESVHMRGLDDAIAFVAKNNYLLLVSSGDSGG